MVPRNYNVDSLDPLISVSKRQFKFFEEQLEADKEYAKAVIEKIFEPLDAYRSKMDEIMDLLKKNSATLPLTEGEKRITCTFNSNLGDTTLNLDKGTICITKQDAIKRYGGPGTLSDLLAKLGLNKDDIEKSIEDWQDKCDREIPIRAGELIREVSKTIQDASHNADYIRIARTGAKGATAAAEAERE